MGEEKDLGRLWAFPFDKFMQMQWIPADILPPDGVPVLAIDKKGFIAICDNSSQAYENEEWREWFSEDYRFDQPPTHWMPLPPPPKGEK